MTAVRSSPRSRRRALALAALALAAVASGCTEKLVEPPAPAAVFGVPDSVQEVFTLHCGFDGCHGGSMPQQGMDLSNARASWLAIVDVPANELPQYRRIAPSDSLNSYIVMKLRNDSRKTGQPMPFGAYPLDAALTLRVAAWAAQGALPQAEASARGGQVASVSDDQARMRPTP